MPRATKKAASTTRKEVDEALASNEVDPGPEITLTPGWLLASQDYFKYERKSGTGREARAFLCRRNGHNMAGAAFLLSAQRFCGCVGVATHSHGHSCRPLVPRAWWCMWWCMWLRNVVVVKIGGGIINILLLE